MIVQDSIDSGRTDTSSLRALKRDLPQPADDNLSPTGQELFARDDTGEPTAGAPSIVMGGEQSANPIGQSNRVVRGTSDDVFGAFSLETFADAGSLSHTHEDAQGWYDYLAKFHTGNFWFKDASVKPWAYYEEYDNWQDTYGIDAVLAIYHSGHGTMDSNGVFWAPLGANWGGLGTWAHSDLMRVGNEQANYIFWSTCLSCRIHDGHSPSRTWRAANLGFRMLFGFETVSVDNPNYGRFFWEEWNKGKSLSTAWMDASWRIAHDQAPSVVAAGANQAEASDRLFNERTLEWPHVSNSWYWWRWYDAARSVNTPSRRPNLRVPSQAGSIRFAPATFSGDRLRSIVKGIGLPIQIPRAVTATKGGVSIREGEAGVAMSMDGTFSARLTEANRENRSTIAAQRAIQVSNDLARQLKIDADVEVVFDQVRCANEGGGSDSGTGRLEGPYTTETTVQYRQIIDGIPVISPSAGALRVGVDNDGRVTSVESSLRTVERVSRSRVGEPPEPGVSAPRGGPALANAYEDKLTRAWGRQLAGFASRGAVPGSFSVLPGSTEIGYAIEGDHATLVAQQTVEVDCGAGLRKRYIVTTPVGE
jgi:hypothetical protein